ncbi:hypothetical protein P9112_013784 [Eukaryota sp. TZLM1-RC]
MTTCDSDNYCSDRVSPSLEILLQNKSREIDLSYNAISNTTLSFAHPEDFISPLLSLQLHHNQISDISFLQHFRYLEHVDLSHNIIQHLPLDVFDNLCYLDTIDLSHNIISSCSSSNPDSSPKSTSLLRLGNNRLDSACLDVIFSYFPNLFFCHLEFNLIKTIPTSFGNLQGLQHLDLSNNESLIISDYSVFSKCYNLISVNLLNTPSAFNLAELISVLPTLTVFNEKQLCSRKKVDLRSFKEKF